jgi:hypothetical protein
MLASQHINTKASMGVLSNITPGADIYTSGSVPTTFTSAATGADKLCLDNFAAIGSAATLSWPAGTSGSTATVNWLAGYVGDVTLTAIAYGCCGPISKSLTLHILPVCNPAYNAQAYNFINYIKETVVRAPGKKTVANVDATAIGQKNVTYTYYSGPGQAIQTVQQQAS